MKKVVDVNKCIGRKLYEARRAAGLSLNDLAQEIGVTGQQLFKYENGTNQININRLLKIVEILSLNLNYFLEDVTPLEHDRETVEYQRNRLNISNDFMQIKDKACQKILSNLIRLLSKKF